MGHVRSGKSIKYTKYHFPPLTYQRSMRNVRIQILAGNKCGHLECLIEHSKIAAFRTQPVDRGWYPMRQRPNWGHQNLKCPFSPPSVTHPYDTLLAPPTNPLPPNFRTHQRPPCRDGGIAHSLRTHLFTHDLCDFSISKSKTKNCKSYQTFPPIGHPYKNRPLKVMSVVILRRWRFNGTCVVVDR